MEFLKSTDQMKKLLILSEIEKGKPVTQGMLAIIAGISVAMVNTYIKNLCNDGYLIMQGNNKNRIYQLTSRGIEQKKYLLVSLMAELIELTSNVSVQIKNILLPLASEGFVRVFLYGAGETGKVCAKVIEEIPNIEVIGFIDDSATIQNTEILGNRVFTLDDALKTSFDKIIITTFVCSLKIKEKIISRLDDHKVKILSDLGTSLWKGGI